ncbi:polysaccharide pyruvyl transferase family protein [Limisphaera sp. VF-2]|uniref:polysaccharide pyruvyl transferase family protein n=1 Tax=Limisphaera sp. VF-2 TaxID=3400418 RepID=UPI003C24BE3D
MNVGILGTPVSSGNRGVMALGASLVRLCAEAGATRIVMFVGHHKPCEVAFRVGDRDVRAQVVNYRLSPRARPCEHLVWIVLASLCYRWLPHARVRRWLSRHTPWIAAIEEMDLVGDIRGGDSFSDIYGGRRFLLGFLAAWSVVLVKGSLVHFPQTYGPYGRRWTRWLARYLLRRAPVVLARDRESQRVAQELVGEKPEVRLSPDVAFALEARAPRRIETDPPLEEGREVLTLGGVGPIGLNVNGLMYNGGYTRKNMFELKLDYVALLPRLIEALFQEHSGELWLIPHTYAPPESVESDPEACRRVRAALPPALQARVRIVTGEYDCHEIKGVIGLCGLFIGSRMHACLGALSQGIPTVGIAYSRKFAGVFESVGMRDWVIDGRTTGEAEAVARVMELYRQREGVRDRLALEAETARIRLREIFGELLRRAVPEGAPLQLEAMGPAVGGALEQQ